MPRGDVIRLGVLGRIANSMHAITIHYPRRRTTVPGTAPVVLPEAPLTGPAPTFALEPQTLNPPEKADLTVQCLWYDLVNEPNQQWNRRSFGTLQWKQGALALVRVSLDDVLLDPDLPYGKTALDECETVEHVVSGAPTLNRYKVIGTTRADSGFLAAYSIFAWLGGAELP